MRLVIMSVTLGGALLVLFLGVVDFLLCKYHLSIAGVIVMAIL